MSELSPELVLIKDAVVKKLDAIQTSLVTADPMLPMHCAAIHKSLLEHEELVHLLPDSQIRILMEGMKKYKNIQLIAETTKSRSKAKVTADDL